MNTIKESELIITPQGQIYHIGLRPEECADTVILVGDPARVERVSRHFDSIEHRSSHREIVVNTGTYRGVRMTVLSSGIGPDNIDIVINELDALKNIDLGTRSIKPKHRPMRIVRIGTSGSLQKEIPVDSYVVSRYGLGLDGVLHFYDSQRVRNIELEDAFIEQTGWNKLLSRPYVVSGDEELFTALSSEDTHAGFTATAIGFYGPQGRVLRLPLAQEDMNSRIERFTYDGLRITNYEM
ncbi:MAG: nucleoside phosphorylase, partial [Flavobacteriales bacterium]|nr:nucleoside phosphorylase [Flavobacteriales bacterium]